MNLNTIETAEALKNISFVTDPTIVCNHAATMLRQQQAEIEALKDCKNQYQEVNRNILNDLMVARKRIEQLLETQDYLYKTHDKDKAEIEAFKNKKCSCNVNTVNNEPVAWMQVHYKDNKPTKFSLVQTWENDIPLYTHPVKELTDEEILISAQYNGIRASEILDEYVIDFARAILRKAQEADKIESLGTVNIGGVHFRNGKEVK